MAKNAKTASTGKNVNPNARVRKLDGKVVKPCLFNGRAAGLGSYYAGEVDGKLVVDAGGRPVPFRKVGALVAV